MSEIRQDRTTGRWVVIAPERGRRPRQWHRCESEAKSAAPFDSACPFCPGNERLLPGIIEEVRSDRVPGWRTRVVSNKYPVLRPEHGSAPMGESTGPVRAGYGYHEVIVETARHDADFTTLSDTDLNAVVRTYRQRYVELISRPKVKAVLVFRNRGRGGGASLVHPHSQVIAIGMMPPQLSAAFAWARSYYAGQGRCVTCEELERELADGRRVVEATKHFLVVVPFAAASPFELSILPRRHQASIAQCDDIELAELGRILQRTLRRLNAVLHKPSYNYVIEAGAAEHADAPYSHWRLRIVPDLVTPGGFELGAGLPINPSRPEEDAGILRAEAIPARGLVK